MKIEFFTESEVLYGNAEDMAKDLNLNFIARNMAKDNYGDVPFILDILQHPLLSVSQIEERQTIVQTACEQAEFVSQLRKVIINLWQELDGSIKAIQDSRGKHLLEQTVIGIQVECIRGLVSGLWQIHELLEENKSICENTAFSKFYQSFYEEEPIETLKEQKELVLYLNSFKDKGEILLQGKIGEGFSLKDVEIMSVKEKARRVGNGLFGGKRGSVIVDEEIYQSGVEFTNLVILEMLEKCVPFLLAWQEKLHHMMRQVMFLAGCAHLYKRGSEYGLYFCFPKKEEEQADKLYELSLGLQNLDLPIHNTVSIANYKAIIVTGANQGGKSTFLRSLGIAQVMCQAGMYVPAKEYPLRVYQNIFTHFTRREDAMMNMGKFEEELKRMEEILYGAKENTLILLNESFATTTEVTAYQIAMDLTHACMQHNVTIWMVTHITKFAQELYQEKCKEVLFLSAGRQDEKELRFSMYEKEPGNTSYGLELYENMIEGGI